MRILQINSHYNQGGAARIVACIHRQLLKEEEDSFVAFGRGRKPEEKNVYRFGMLPEIYFSALVSRAAGVSGWANGAATRRLITYMERVKPELIHLHALHGYYLNLPLLFHYINEHRIPCVWTFHDCYAFTGNCGYFFECEKWKTGCGSCPNIHNYPNSQWLDFSAWMWERKRELFTQGDNKIIVTPSEWLTKEAEKSFLGKYECITIRNGIDTRGTFYPRNRQECRKKYGYTESEKLILGIAVGYDDVRKGAKYIIQLAKDLEKEARIILIGWNEKNNAMLEGTKNIITLPNTSSTEMLAEYYSMADVFVLPSLAENYATVTLEAMACGTPVVGFWAGGIPEQLTGGKGIAVETGNQSAFDEAVRRALADKGETAEGKKAAGLLRGEALADIIRKENSTEKMTEEYLRVYRRLLKRSHERLM